MNPGLLDLTTQYAQMPRGLLGLPTPIPTIDARVPFDPRRIAAPAVWVDFADASVVRLDGNGLIREVLDKSGLARNPVQGTASNRPLVGAMNGVACADFGTAANNRTLAWNSGTTTQAWTETFMVAQWTGSTGAFPGGFFGLWSGTNGTGGIGVLSDSGNANWNGGGIQNISHNGGALAISPFPLIEQPTILRWTGSGTRVGYRISGDRDNFAASRGWRGRVGELIMFTTTLTDDQRRSMVVALAQKWGVRL